MSDTSSTSTQWTAGTNYQVFYIQMAPPRPQPLPVALVEEVWDAAALLDIDLPTDRKAVQRARRLLAREHHPDVGGSVEQMQQINAAADLLLRGCP